MCRSLLLFNPIKDNYYKPLNEKGLTYLLFYFATLAGKNKLTFEDRIQWSRDNILTIYDFYIQNKEKFFVDYLENYKEPLQFMSIMFAIVNSLIGEREGKLIFVNNPILFDASCNGLQHLSALTRELNTAIQTNLVSLPSDKDIPKDYYTFAADIVQKEIDICDNNNIRKLKINRKFIKKTVMTIPYNISLFGVKEQLIEHLIIIKEGKKYFYKVPTEFTKTDNEIIFLYPKEIIYLAGIVFNGLINNLPSLKLLNKYIDQLLSILLKLNCPIFWITPSGLKITLSTIKFKEIRTSSTLIPFGKPVTISVPTNKLNIRKIKTSFMPNLVHSLDASNIHILSEKLTYQPLYTIHDCFATTANNMEDIERKVKASFIEIYFNNENYLEKMHISIIDQIKSFKHEIININGDEHIIIDNIKYVIPKLPESFTNTEIMNIFIQGIKKSKFFIS